MNDEYNPFLEANRNLSEKIKKLEAELKIMWIYKEEYDRAVKDIEALREDLFRKRNVVRVTKKKDNIIYVLMITRVEDTPEGMFIEVAE